MIKYNLICSAGHEFEAWFSSSAGFETQRDKGQIACIICGNVDIDRAIMAPHVSTGRRQDEITKDRAHNMQMVNAAADKIRREITQTCDDVGKNFAEEARAIHYGEKPVRGIYGQAAPKEVAALHEEGVTALPLPDILMPKAKSKIN